MNYFTSLIPPLIWEYWCERDIEAGRNFKKRLAVEKGNDNGNVDIRDGFIDLMNLHSVFDVSKLDTLNSKKGSKSTTTSTPLSTFSSLPRIPYTILKSSPFSTTTTIRTSSHKFDYYGVDEEGLFINTICAILGGVACLSIKYAGSNNCDVVRLITYMASVILGYEHNKRVENVKGKEKDNSNEKLDGWNVFDLLGCDVLIKSVKKDGDPSKANGKCNGLLIRNGKNAKKAHGTKGLHDLYSFLYDCIEGKDEELVKNNKLKKEKVTNQKKEIEISKMEKEDNKKKKKSSYNGVENCIKEELSGGNNFSPREINFHDTAPISHVMNIGYHVREEVEGGNDTPPPREVSINDIGSVGRTVHRVDGHPQVYD
jgi:hypothetical protein